MANVHYPHLFTPITVRGKRIKNRIASAPHCGPNMFRCGENGYSKVYGARLQHLPCAPCARRDRRAGGNGGRHWHS